MRKFIRQIIAQFFILFGFVNRKNKYVHSQDLITSIYFHNPSKELFEKCVNWLVKNNYYFISTQDLYEVLFKNKSLKSGAVCITVDDGKKGNLENIIPYAEKLNIPVTIFVSTEPVESGAFWWSYVTKNNEISNKKVSLENCKRLSNSKRVDTVNELKKQISLTREAMTKNDVVRISKLENITIGNHTVNHPITKKCKKEELRYEISEASKILKSWISKDIDFFAYPNGDYDGREEAILLDNNIKLAFTTEPKHIDIVKKYNPYQIPRFSVNDDGSFAENICKMVGVWQAYVK